MSKYVIIIGSKGFKQHLKDYHFKETFKGFEITEEKGGALLILSKGNDEFVITEYFGSGVSPSKHFKDCKAMFLLGMCYGFRGVKVLDYLLPNVFLTIEKMSSVYSVTAKISKMPLSRKIKLNNVLEKFIKENYPNKTIHKKSLIRNVAVITNPFGVFTPDNVELMDIKDLKGGEMESYYVAKLSKEKYKVPFGCLLICTDDEEHDLFKYNSDMLRVAVKVIKGSNNGWLKEMIPKELSALNEDEKVRLYNKLRGKMAKFPEIEEEFKKRRHELIIQEHKPKFGEALKEIFKDVLPKLVKHLVLNKRID